MLYYMVMEYYESFDCGMTSTEINIWPTSFEALREVAKIWYTYGYGQRHFGIEPVWFGLSYLEQDARRAEYLTTQTALDEAVRFNIGFCGGRRMPCL